MHIRREMRQPAGRLLVFKNEILLRFAKLNNKDLRQTRQGQGEKNGADYSAPFLLFLTVCKFYLAKLTERVSRITVIFT